MDDRIKKLDIAIAAIDRINRSKEHPRPKASPGEKENRTYVETFMSKEEIDKYSMTDVEAEAFFGSVGDSWEDAVTKDYSKPVEVAVTVEEATVTPLVTVAVTDETPVTVKDVSKDRMHLNRAKKYSAKIRKAKALAEKDLQTLRIAMKGKTQAECNIIVDNFMHMLETQTQK